MTTPTRAAPSTTVDRLGAIASTACAVHCLGSALLPGAIAVLGLGAVFGHEAEWAFTVTAVLLATVALVLGWRRHRSRPIAAALSVGIVALMLSRVVEGAGGEIAGAILGVGAGLALVVGHVSGVLVAKRR